MTADEDPRSQAPASPGRAMGMPMAGSGDPAVDSPAPGPVAVPDLVVDCLGRPCPVPVIELARALPTVAVGGVVEVLSDDPAATHDVPAWCRMRGQEYLGATARGQRVRRLS